MAAEITPELIVEVTNNAHGNLARTRELIEQYPGLLNARSPLDETPIQAATQLANLPIIEYLIARGAPVDFFTAIVLGRVDEVLSELESSPARVHDRGVHGLPALYFAAIGGSVEMADLLHRHGAGVNETCQSASPLHGAIMGRNSELMVRWLLERGADPAAPNFQGKGARELAQQLNKAEVVALFES